jgi:DNA-binding MarR family transcriptional regulator
MKVVKGDRLLDLPDDVQASVLMGVLLSQVSSAVARADLDGLRPSHFRLLAHAAAPGIRITELSQLLGMTKQACGQFVTQLTSSGHVVVEVPADDRRARIVQRTAQGSAELERFADLMTALERGWAERVGVERYGGFLDVLRDLVAAPDS